MVNVTKLSTSTLASDNLTESRRTREERRASGKESLTRVKLSVVAKLLNVGSIKRRGRAKGVGAIIGVLRIQVVEVSGKGRRSMEQQWKRNR